MLDKSTAKLLSVVSKICADGSYKIIEIGDLIKEMLPRFHVDAGNIGHMMRYLADNEMIDIKYNDENVFCIAILPKGRVATEMPRNEKQDRRMKKAFLALLYGGCFLAAFVGGLVGAIVGGLC